MFSIRIPVHFVFLALSALGSSKTFALTNALNNDKDPYGCITHPIKVSLYSLGLFYDENSNVGIDKDLIDLLGVETGCKLTVSVKPRARIWTEIATGIETEMTTSGISNPDRLKFAEFAPYIRAKNYVIVSSDLVPLNNLEEFLTHDNRTFIGVVRSFKHDELLDTFLETARKENRVKDFATAEIVLEKFKAKEIQMFFGLNLVYPLYFKDPNFKKSVKIYDFAKSSVEHSLVLSKARFSTDQIKKWQALILKLNKNGKIKGLLKKHIPEDLLKSTLL